MGRTVLSEHAAAIVYGQAADAAAHEQHDLLGIQRIAVDGHKRLGRLLEVPVNARGGKTVVPLYNLRECGSVHAHGIGQLIDIAARSRSLRFPRTWRDLWACCPDQ